MHAKICFDVVSMFHLAPGAGVDKLSSHTKAAIQALAFRGSRIYLLRFRFRPVCPSALGFDVGEGQAHHRKEHSSFLAPNRGEKGACVSTSTDKHTGWLPCMLSSDAFNQAGAQQHPGTNKSRPLGFSQPAWETNATQLDLLLINQGLVDPIEEVRCHQNGTRGEISSTSAPLSTHTSTPFFGPSIPPCPPRR